MTLSLKMMTALHDEWNLLDLSRSHEYITTLSLVPYVVCSLHFD